MRKTKTIQLGETDVVVSELTMKEIAGLAAGDDQQPVETLARLISASTGMTAEQVAEHTPSELAPLVEAMLEVNADFFAQARAAGMGETADHLEALIKKIFIVAFLLSSAPATAQ